MTDNTQELDEILREMRYRTIEDNGLTVNGLITIEQETKQAILDWHNKQVEEVIGEYEKLGLPTTQAQEQSNYDKRVRNAMRDWQREAAGLPTRYDSYKLKEIEQ